MKMFQKIVSGLMWWRRKKPAKQAMVDQIIDRALSRARKKEAEAVRGMFTALQEAEIRFPHNYEG